MRHIGMHAQQACGHTAAAQSSGRASQLLTAAYGHGAERLAELSHAMRTTDFGRLWLVQLLMINGPSTRAEDLVV